MFYLAWTSAYSPGLDPMFLNQSSECLVSDGFWDVSHFQHDWWSSLYCEPRFGLRSSSHSLLNLLPHCFHQTSTLTPEHSFPFSKAFWSSEFCERNKLLSLLAVPLFSTSTPWVKSRRISRLILKQSLQLCPCSFLAMYQDRWNYLGSYRSVKQQWQPCTWT